MNTGDLAVRGILKAGVWQRIYSSGEFAASASSVTISGLDGDTDQFWLLKCKLYTIANNNFYIQPNSISTVGNYGYQDVTGTDAVIAGFRDTAEAQIRIGNGGALGDLSQTETIIYAKSGTIRTFIGDYSDSVRTTSVSAIGLVGQSWLDTSVNITSLKIASQSGIGSTSTIDLYRRVDATVI